MSVCSFAKEYSNKAVTNVDNAFINNYLSLADGNAVKVYLYGLSLCQSGLDFNIDDFSQGVNMQKKEIIDCFKFWQEFDLVQIISNDPFAVQYLPISHTTLKPRKYNVEKYSDFSKTLQTVISSRMINTTEYTEYYNIMETFGIKPEAFILIVKYCIETKGENISYKYISQVAKDFGARGIVTVSNVDEALSSHYSKNDDITNVMLALGSKKKPEIEDTNLLKKWQEMGYDTETVCFCAKKSKKNSMEKLDEFIDELYNARCFGETEIADYIKNKTERNKTTVEIAKLLGKYIEVAETYAENFVCVWNNLGFSFDALKVIAKYCFSCNQRSFEQMDKTVKDLANQGYISNQAITEFFINTAKQDEFVGKILEICGLNRKANAWDISSYKSWKNWNFTDEMIEKAAQLASGKSSPIPYINATLGAWKTQGIFSPEQIPTYNKPVIQTVPTKSKEEIERQEHIESAKENYEKMLNESKDFAYAENRLPAIELELAYAEINKEFDKLDELNKEKEQLQAKRLKALSKFGLTENDIKY